MIDKATIQEMASWVRVRVPDDEAEKMAVDFSETLAWIGERLKNPALKTVPPMVTPFDEGMTLRTDVVTDGNQRAALLANAPDATDQFFCVPKMVE